MGIPLQLWHLVASSGASQLRSVARVFLWGHSVLLFSCRSQRRPEAALLHLDIALQLAPTNALVVLNKGAATAMLGGDDNLQEALKLFDRALQLQPSLVRAHLNKLAVFRRQGDVKHAEWALSQAISLVPDAATLYILRAQLLSPLNGRLREVMVDLATALWLDPLTQLGGGGLPVL